MRAQVISVLVDDQAKAQEFYTGKLGFLTKMDVPLGEGARWLTVVSPEEPDGVQIALEPAGYDFAVAYQKGLRDNGIPANMLFVDDIAAEFERLRGLGVEFRGEPASGPGGIMVIFDDTCGNLLGLMQVVE